LEAVALELVGSVQAVVVDVSTDVVTKVEMAMMVLLVIAIGVDIGDGSMLCMIDVESSIVGPSSRDIVVLTTLIDHPFTPLALVAIKVASSVEPHPN